MGRATSLLSLSSRSSSLSSENRSNESLLPCSEPLSEKRYIRIRSLLGSSFYRRVLKWTLASLLLLAVLFFLSADVSAPEVVHLGNNRLAPQGPPQLVPVQPQGNRQPQGHGVPGAPPPGNVVVVVQDGSERLPASPNSLAQPDGIPQGEMVNQIGLPQELLPEDNEAIRRMPWLAFKHLDGYFNGLKTLVGKVQLLPEYPNVGHQAPLPAPTMTQQIPTPQAYNPYPSEGIRTCYLDTANKIPAPAMYAYQGVPQHMPDPVFGSYDMFGIRDDVCFDRFSRYGPYGLGYPKLKGGAGVGAETESSGSNAVWASTGRIDYSKMDWGQAQERCVAANKDRFLEPDAITQELPTGRDRPHGKKGRMAVVVRCYQGFRWTDHSILNFRAMVTELSLKSGGEYSVHLLLHIHDTDEPIWADDLTVQRLLDAHIPTEFHGLVTLWSEPQMKLFYPGQWGETLENDSGADIHGVYRSAHMPLQVFAMQHPEYEHIWNWEMDMRCLGNYYELFDRIGHWAESQPRALLWERNARYYIPSHHGSWENFTDVVRSNVEASGEQPIFGPVQFRGRKPLRREERGESMLPDNCNGKKHSTDCGVGEAADIITLNPMFDTFESGWVFSNDVTGYDEMSYSTPPRRCAIVTAARLSRRLLTAMHEETWRHHHSMFSEMFPPTVALHHGLKGVYAPHPTYFDRAWQPLGSSVDKAFNSGKFHSVSGRNSPYDLENEHNHKGTTWYYHSEFAGLLWRRWLGYPQMDGRGRAGGRGGSGTRRGGVAEEGRSKSSGRMCLRSMLLHPIKHEHPSEEPPEQ
ncbi:hypothetical protein HIM_02111 [Hirsutella minnesotensis 3608]|nr:hypothetical protein HIM_02111 [Hirsutella minnesotensis 3608]